MTKLKIADWVWKTTKGALILLVLLYAYGTPLPEPDDILATIKQNPPAQEAITGSEPFTKNYIDLDYKFTPLASYEITGLVVSLHQSDSAIDISHKFDPANTTDVCVVWGKNITSNAYREVSYSHGDWTCYYEWHGDVTPDFHGDMLSNSHLIPTSYEQYKLIKSLQVGDQIRMTGTLVDYDVTNKKTGEKIGYRRTSLTRTDAGNGACEIIFLSDVQMLKRNVPWRIPLRNFLFIIIALCVAYTLYTIIPKHKNPVGEITGKPHVKNPYDVQNFLKRKLMPNQKQQEKLGTISAGNHPPSEPKTPQ